ncbi:MAG: restriction endonuclease subunit S [Kiritimatiellia bacterium]
MENGTCRKMKDSGIEWLGEVPEGWSVDRIASLYTHRNEKVSDRDYAPLSVTMKGILPQLETAAKTDDGDNRKRVCKGDFAINSRSDRRGACGISSYEGSVSLINTILSPRESMDPGYYNWLFHTASFADEYYKWGHGIVDDLWTTRWSEMKRISIVRPPLPEQRKIATYLDRTCAKIDEIVAGTKQTIEEYKAWKASLIQEEMLKNHSFLQPLKSVASYNDETLEEETDRDYEFDYVDIGAVKYGSGIVSRERMHFAESPSRARRVVKPGDVIVSTVRTYLRSVSIIPRFRVPLIVSTGFIVLRAKHIDSGYLQYAILSEGFISQVEANSVGISYPAINASQIVAFKIPVPCGDAQRRIAVYLDKKCAAIDRVIAEKEALIADLEAYRKSLIFEVVTGKRSVGENGLVA